MKSGILVDKSEFAHHPYKVVSTTTILTYCQLLYSLTMVIEKKKKIVNTFKFVVIYVLIV